MRDSVAAMSNSNTNMASGNNRVLSKHETEHRDGSNNEGGIENPNWEEVEIAEKPESELHNGQVRVLLWSYPRTVSTAFVRSVTMIPKIKIFNELYSAAFMLGPDRKRKIFPRWSPSYSYKHCKDRLESEQPEYDCVFAKEFALDMHMHLDWIPKS